MKRPQEKNKMMETVKGGLAGLIGGLAVGGALHLMHGELETRCHVPSTQTVQYNGGEQLYTVAKDVRNANKGSDISRSAYQSLIDQLNVPHDNFKRTWTIPGSDTTCFSIAPDAPQLPSTYKIIDYK